MSRVLALVVLLAVALGLWSSLRAREGASDPAHVARKVGEAGSPSGDLSGMRDSAEEPRVAVPGSSRDEGESAPGERLVTIRGTLFDAAGRRLTNRSDAVSLDLGGGMRGNADTDREGGYSLTRSRSLGRVTLEAHARDCEPVTQTLDLAAAADVIRRDFHLACRWELDVRLLTPDHESLLDVLPERSRAFELLPFTVVATREPPPPMIPELPTGPHVGFGLGIFRDTVLPILRTGWEGHLGRLELLDPGPLVVSLVMRQAVIETRPLSPTAAEIVFQVEPERLIGMLGAVRGRVVEAETHRPVVGQVSLSPTTVRMPSVPLNEDGTFAFDDVLPGELLLHVYAVDLVKHAESVTVLPGQRVELGDVLVEAAVSISGRCVAPGGRGTRANLAWGRIDADTREVHWLDRGPLSLPADGTFTIRDLRPGRWLLRVKGDEEVGFFEQPTGWGADAIVVDATREAVEDVVIHLREVVPVTFVSRGDGAQYRLRDAGGHVIRTGQLTDARSQLSLVPGAYELELHRGGSRLDRCEVLVGTAPVEVVVDP